MKTRTGLTVMLTVVLVAPTDVGAQLGFLDAVGYGSAGLVLGAVATAGASCDEYVCIHPVAFGGAVLGAILGGRVGRRAESSTQRGEAVGYLPIVAAGAVLGGAALGLSLGAAATDWSDATWGFGAAGALLTVLYLRSRWDALTVTGLTLSPAVIDGRPGLAALIRF